jgi:AcrR family transcriptional regulator
MPPEERRAALIAATLPLVREHGLAVSTRQIARAAGVAEGTIFNVFPDKQSLIQAAVLSAFDPEAFQRALGTIDPTADLRDRLRMVAEIAMRRMMENGPIMAAMHRSATSAAAADLDSLREDPVRAARVASEFFVAIHRARAQMIAAVAAIIEPDAARLRRSPNITAELLLAMLSIYARSGDREMGSMDSDEIVTLLLDGILVRAAPGSAVIPATPATNERSTFTGDPAPC